MNRLIILRNEFNDFTVRPKIDAEIADLSRLVSGQRKVKKKKPKQKAFRPISYRQRSSYTPPKKNYFTQTSRNSASSKASQINNNFAPLV